MSDDRERGSDSTPRVRLTKRETTPRAFLNISMEYCQAADILLVGGAAKPRVQASLNPVYLLYSHAAETALKAFLRYKGYATGDLRKKEVGHKLSVLYLKCREAGLVPPNDLKADLESITQLLDSGNKDAAFRYWNPESLVFPDINWAKDVVNRLVALVGGLLPPKSKPGKVVKIDMTVGKPRPIGDRKRT